MHMLTAISSYSSMESLKTRLQHSVTPDSLRAYLAEFISTFFFVFAVAGSSMASGKMMADFGSDPSSLLAIALANAFALSAAVYISANISGGHVNPAVTFSMAISGHISAPTAIFYWISQIFGSVMASLLFKVATVGQHVPVHAIPTEMTGFGASILEGVMTFALVYTFYAARLPRRDSLAPIGPLMIGLISGANVLASGPFTGGSMNPAFSFGYAVICGSFKNQAVYWIGPLIGAMFAGVLYDNVLFPDQRPDSLTGV